MTVRKQLSSFMTTALLCGAFPTLASGQQTAAATVVVAPAATAQTDAALLKSTAPLTEDELRARYVGKLIFLRGSYLGDELNFDQDGRVNGAPTIASFTLSAFEA